MKKVQPQCGKVPIMTEYEKGKLNKLKLNASRMEARGIGSLANQILASQLDSYKNGILEEEDMISEELNSEDMSDEVGDEDYQPNQVEDCEVDQMHLVPDVEPTKKASKNEISSSTKKERRPLKQTLPMAEFAKTRNKKHLMHQQQLKSMQEVPENIQDQYGMQPAKGNDISKEKTPQQPNLHQVSAQHNSKLQRQQQNPQEVLKRKKMSKEQQLQKKKLQRSQCCSPGSLNLYNQVRQKQLGDKRLSNVRLPQNTFVRDEAYESMLSLIPRDQFVDGSPSSINPPEVSVVNENEANENILNFSTQDQFAQGSPRSTNQDSTHEVAEKKKRRGPTLMIKVHRRPFEERPQVFLNEKGQPIGPPSVVTELAGFLGTIAKDPELAPINILDWKCMPTKDTIWSYVKEKYKIEEEGKKYVLQTINDDWRVYKSRLKRKHYKAFETNEERWSNRPATIPENQFNELLDYWDGEVGKEIANINATNCQKHEDAHTLGPRSIARLRHELKEKSTNKELPSDSVVYKLSRKRNPTHAYKTNGCKTKENIEKMNDIQLQIERGEKDKNADPFSEVISKEHKGRLFLQGRGLKKPVLKDKEKKGGYIVDKEFFQNMKAEWEEEIIPTLVSKVMSQLQAANPQINLILPSFVSAQGNPNQDENVEDVEDGAN